MRQQTHPTGAASLFQKRFGVKGCVTDDLEQSFSAALAWKFKGWCCPVHQHFGHAAFEGQKLVPMGLLSALHMRVCFVIPPSSRTEVKALNCLWLRHRSDHAAISGHVYLSQTRLHSVLTH